MRGTRVLHAGERENIGIIPAYAGNTNTQALTALGVEDHPRVCGEHISACWNPFVHLGSSPRMRGTHSHSMVTARQHGIIPAYAGNTEVSMKCWTVPRDHPRVCGEHHAVIIFNFGVSGSSPRMRGTHPREFVAQVGEGIIPAYAGNTVNHGLAPSRHKDHPRVCGEHSAPQKSHTCKKGSSPRMRGTLPPRHCRVHSSGIIPAYAGNTLGNSMPETAPRDHPRVCGEHAAASGIDALGSGSSPRMRGTH